MASEPGNGQQKKLHPLFTTLHDDRKGANGATNSDYNPIQGPSNGYQETSFPKTPIDPGLLALDRNGTPHMPDGREAPATATETIMRSRPTNMSDKTTPHEATQPQMTQFGALLPGSQGGTISSEALKTETSLPPVQSKTANPPVPIPIEKNAFARLQAKRKSGDNLQEAAVEGSLQAPEPKRKGRPPKKRKSSPEASDDMGQSSAQVSVPPALLSSGLQNGGTPATSAVDGISPTAATSLTSTSTSASGEAVRPVTAIASDTPVQRPIRLLQLNPKTGTIGSPPAKVSKNAKPTSRPKPLVVLYGEEDESERARIGRVIDSILSGERKASASLAAPQPTSTPKTAVPTTKNTHPFFMAGRSKQSSTSQSAGEVSASKPPPGANSMKQYTSTPCSPKRPRTSQVSSGFKMLQFGAKNGTLRVPGSRLPAWPARGAVHVQPEEDSALIHSAKTPLPLLPSSLNSRKSKGNAIHLRADELILEQKLQNLGISSVVQDIRDANADDFAPPPPELRVPQKHIESGDRLQSRVTPQLRTNHSSLQPLFASISTTLSAFDQYECESLSWTQKYAPSCAAEVVQSGEEPLLLRSWLEALKVVSVDTGSGDTADPGISGKANNKTKPKKKRKKNKLDDFIVSSEDEDEDLGETSDNEADWSASGRHGLQKKTVVRSGNLLDRTGRSGARLANAVVISGPHGCGKSAAVYAVAKELGFEVFEINASSRRSGKDVIDRIGDMTRNHLVQHKRNKLFKKDPPLVTEEPEDEYSMSDLEDADGDPDPDFPEPVVATTKQQTMNSFFKPKAPATTATGAEPKQQGPSAADATTAKSKPGEQKQSLILLEEADILYEEDRQFWATVMGLIVQSKRPFVITCNDETLIPLHQLRLHAIFRFTAPPTDAAVDRLLLVAASEGHVLRRDAVQSLFEARSYDFRASLMDLQFWCQIGVGDRRGGFGWFVQRWPEGIDVDENGHIKRVVSEGTYQKGMGWLNHDVAASMSTNTTSSSLQESAEESLLQQAWVDWQLDIGQWQDSHDLASWAEQLDSSAAGRRQALQSYSDFADAMSDADLVSANVFATGNKAQFDASQPEHPPGAREDYILGLQLLDRTTTAYEYDTLRLPMATSMRCAAKKILKAKTSPVVGRDTESCGWLNSMDAAKVTDKIRKQHTEPLGLIPSDANVISRIDFSLAFDPITTANGAAGTSASTSSTSHSDISVFDRNMSPIAVDVAPFVRGIIAYEGRLQKKRQKLSTFLIEASSSAATSDGEVAEGPALPSRRAPKRMRTTRTALSALEGGPRNATRMGNWFSSDINPILVMQTAGDGWSGLVEAVLVELGKEAAKADAAMAEAARAEPTTPLLGPADHGISVAPFPVAAASNSSGTPESVGVGSHAEQERVGRRQRRDVVMSSPGDS